MGDSKSSTDILGDLLQEAKLSPYINPFYDSKNSALFGQYVTRLRTLDLLLQDAEDTLREISKEKTVGADGNTVRSPGALLSLGALDRLKDW